MDGRVVSLRAVRSGVFEVWTQAAPGQTWQKLTSQDGFYAVPRDTRLSASLKDFSDSRADLALLGELPRDQLVDLGLSWCEQAEDDLMELVSRFENLEGLGIGGSSVTDKGLAKLTPLRHLGSVIAFSTRIRGSGFGSLAGSPISRLDLDHSSIDNDGLRAIGGLATLKELHLEATSITDEGIPSLATCRTLTTLRAQETEVSGTTFGSLAGLPLRELSLESCPLTAEGLAAALSIGSLRVLGLRGTPTEDSWLPAPSSWPPLEYLGLGETKIGPAAGSLLGQLTSLQGLELHGAQIGDDGVRGLGRLERLNLLHIGNAGISGSGLTALEQLPVLETLYAFQNPLMEDAFVHLGRLEALRGLFLSHVALDGAWLRHLAGLTGLQTLDLRATGISSDDLAPVAEMASLRELHLQGNPGVDDEAVEHIGRLPNLSAFSTVNTGITDAGRERLRDLLPDCRLR